MDLWFEELHEQSDPFAGPPERWPAELFDRERWTFDPDQGDDQATCPDLAEDADDDTDSPGIAEADEPEPAYEPSDADRSWLAPQDLAEDAEDLQASAAWAERLEDLHRVTDQDVARVTGCVG